MENNIDGYKGSQLSNVTISASGYTGTKISSGNNTNYTPVSKLNDAKVEVFDFASYYDMTFAVKTRGFYGANQATPVDLFEIYIENYPYIENIEYVKTACAHCQTYINLFEKAGITDVNDIFYYLNKLKCMGCGYSACANIIADVYKDDPEAFEKEYGYPLYDVNGFGADIINYDLIIVDLFTRDKVQENLEKIENSALTKIKNNERVTMYEFFSILTTPGVDFSVRFEDFDETLQFSLGDKTVTVECCNRDSSVETYKEKMQSGNFDYAVVAVAGFTLQMNAWYILDEEPMDFKGGHWMSVTGVSDNDKLIVSSWGYQWELLDGIPATLTQDGGLIFIKIEDDTNEK